jgi:elongation factor Ts
MAITASDVAQLRKLTGVGMMEAKKALETTGGDVEKAIEELRKSGAAKAAKKSDRATGEGRVHCYTHGTGKIGVMVEVLCETDFVARNEAFIALCGDLAMHIAASNPLYVSREEVPAELVEKEKTILTEMLVAEGKPADMLEKIVEGKLNKFYEDMCLLEQRFIKDEDMTIQKFLESKVLNLGENIKISRFARLQIG